MLFLDCDLSNEFDDVAEAIRMPHQLKRSPAPRDFHWVYVSEKYCNEEPQ